ncbi:MAG: GyrI-like domain-containing protein [Lactovum sp.]
MPYDFKKEEKEIYGVKKAAKVLTLPSLNYMAIFGEGNPNEENGDYQKTIQTLYPLAYTLRMSYKTDYKIKGFFEYVVPPLEGLWWQKDIKGYDPSQKNKFQWISMIRLPNFIQKSDLNWAIKKVEEKKDLDASHVNFYSLSEGLCAQITHIGPFDEEFETVKKMQEFLDKNGYITDLNDKRHHHEIYLSDPRKTSPEKLKTIIRHPIKKLQ